MELPYTVRETAKGKLEVTFDVRDIGYGKNSLCVDYVTRKIRHESCIELEAMIIACNMSNDLYTVPIDYTATLANGIATVTRKEKE